MISAPNRRNFLRAATGLAVVAPSTTRIEAFKAALARIPCIFWVCDLSTGAWSPITEEEWDKLS